MNTPTFTSPAARRIGKRVRTRREELGLTQDQLAENSGVSQGSISRIERGDALPSLRSLMRLKSALGLTDDEFSQWLEAAA